MKNKGTTLIYTILIVLAIIIALSAYTVKETEQVIITQLGKPVGDAIVEPGLKFRTPFLQKVHRFEKRYLEWDGEPELVTPKDKQYIFVDAYSRWRITDPLQFYKRVANETGAQTRLDDIIDGETKKIIANHNIEEIVRSINRTPVRDTVESRKDDTLKTILTGREKIQEMIEKNSNDRAKDLGIEIMDFRFKRIIYNAEVSESVYNRMRVERNKIADEYRSEGQGEASRINGLRDKELKTIQSGAYKEAQKIMGKADAEAAAIYANAYDRSGQSRQLYSFLKSMETFEKTFDSSTSRIISTDSDLFKYLKGY